MGPQHGGRKRRVQDLESALCLPPDFINTHGLALWEAVLHGCAQEHGVACLGAMLQGDPAWVPGPRGSPSLFCLYRQAQGDS